MSGNGDFTGSPVDFPGISYAPSYEAGVSWSTQYTSELGGALALSQGLYFVSNFATRDIAGKTEGVCVNPWDFNFSRWRDDEGNPIRRPENYSKTKYTKCDCSYHRCDREFQGLGYTLDFEVLIDGEGGMTGLREAFGAFGEPNEPANLTARMRGIGFPVSFGDPTNLTSIGIIDAEKFNQYKTQLASLDSLPQGKKETNYLTYALIDICKSVTTGVFLKNNIVSLLALSQGTLEFSGQGYGGSFENGGDDWNRAAEDIIRNYERNADIPGFTGEFLFATPPSEQNITERCMCLDGGLYGYDAVPFADYQIVAEQLSEQFGINGRVILSSIGFNGNTLSPSPELAQFLALDGSKLKAYGVEKARDYKYGPNWAYGYGWGEQNVISVSTPQFKNWEARDSSKIRMSGVANGEPYSFGNLWLEWGQRIGEPPIEVVPKNAKTLGGGDFTDANFGYKGSLEGSAIYRGKLTSDVLAYDSQDYEFAFLGISAGGQIGVANNAKKIMLTLTTISHQDAATNAEAYGVTGSIEDIVFSSSFSDSPQDKTIYRL